MLVNLASTRATLRGAAQLELSHYVSNFQQFDPKGRRIVSQIDLTTPSLPRRVKSRLGRIAVATGLRAKKAPEVQGFDPNTGLQVDAAVYFPDNMTKVYQLTQWLPVLENHPADMTVGIIVRNRTVFEALSKATKLPIALVPTFAQLMELYRVSSFNGIIYVNNGVGNFQSLSVPELAHIHVNHGESDKICMVSNQVKAYDRVFVAGEAAVQRHRAALSEFNEELLIRVGRPQLDQTPKASIPESSRRTVLYAPTWAGEDEANNYTSMESMGSSIVEAALKQENVRVIYKPHPRVPGATDPRIVAQHNTIIKLISQAQKSEPNAGHAYLIANDILSLYPRTDLLITDVSSVGLDFLYLRPEAPMILTDRRNDRGTLNRDAPISVATPVLTDENIGEAASIIRETLESDKNVAKRHTLRTFYFDQVEAGQSTPRFYSALKEAISAHKTDMERARSLASHGTGPRLEGE